jgi:hypothetical protein
MPAWSLLTNHSRVLLCIAHDPGLRLRDIAATLGITERSAHSIIADLTQAGYVMKTKDGRRNRYQIQARVPLPEPGTRAPAIGEVLAVLLGDTIGISGFANSDGVDGVDGEPRGPAKAIKGMIAQARQDSAASDQTTSDGLGADRSDDELRPARRETR